MLGDVVLFSVWGLLWDCLDLGLRFADFECRVDRYCCLGYVVLVVMFFSLSVLGGCYVLN